VKAVSGEESGIGLVEAGVDRLVVLPAVIGPAEVIFDAFHRLFLAVVDEIEDRNDADLAYKHVLGQLGAGAQLLVSRVNRLLQLHVAQVAQQRVFRCWVSLGQAGGFGRVVRAGAHRVGELEAQILPLVALDVG
jgi:hypothetical protein